MTDKPNYDEYFYRDEIERLIEEIAKTEDIGFHPSQIISNTDIEEKEVFEVLEDFLNNNVLHLYFHIDGGNTLYPTLNDIPEKKTINGKEITVTEENIAVYFVFSDTFKEVIRIRKTYDEE